VGGKRKNVRCDVEGEIPLLLFSRSVGGGPTLAGWSPRIAQISRIYPYASSLNGAEIVVRASPTRQPRAIIHLESRREVGLVTSSRACVHIDNPPTSLRDWHTQNELLNKCATKFAQRFLEEV
jgi:hypothetical protein